MDDLTYYYDNVKINRLLDVAESSSFTSGSIDDITPYTYVPNQRRMSYDEIGNLVSDKVSSNSDVIKWNLYGKVKIR